MSLIAHWPEHHAASDADVGGLAPGLFIGSLSERDEMLAECVAAKRAIAVVCCLVEEEPLPEDARQLGCEQLCIPVDDADDAPIEASFDAAADFIDASRRQGRPVLVHCRAGVSRSATVAMAYLMLRSARVGGRPCTAEAAANLVCAKRPIVRPNDGFLEKLLALESRLFPSLGSEATEDGPRASTLDCVRGVLAPKSAWMPLPVTLDVASYLASLPGIPASPDDAPDLRAALDEYIAVAQAFDPSAPPDSGAAQGSEDWADALGDWNDLDAERAPDPEPSP